MGTDSNLFKITFLMSLVIHAVFFLPLPELSKTQKKEIHQLDLNYLTLNVPAKKKIKIAKFKHKKIDASRNIELSEKNTVEIPADSMAKKPEIKNKDNDAQKPQDEKADIVKLEQKPQILSAGDELNKKDLSKNKSYISYYKLINEQLRQAVIYPAHFSEGEISLTFVLDSEGRLKNVEVMQTASLQDEILKETAMQIVKRASPFPPFPKNLQHKQLTFNIVFCFKESS